MLVTFPYQVELGLVLVYGQALKVVCNAYHWDTHTSAPLSFPRCLWQGPEKYRTVGSWMLTLGLIFLLPAQVFELLLSYQYQGIPAGYVSVMLLGFSADDLFLVLYVGVARTMRRMMDRFGIETNGRFNGNNGKKPPRKELS